MRVKPTTTGKAPKRGKSILRLCVSGLALMLSLGCTDDDPELGRLQGNMPPPSESKTDAPLCAADLACRPVYEPSVLSMGTVSPGALSTGIMTVVNQGNGDCLLDSVELIGCRHSGANFTCDKEYVSAFDLNAPWTPGERLGPNEAMNIEIAFQAPSNAEFSLARLRHYARVTAWFSDPCQETGLRTPPWEGSQGVNLRAEIDGAYASVEPGQIDFGMTGATCPVVSKKVTLSNLGPTPYNVTGVALSGCGNIVQVSGKKALPIEMPGFSQHILDLTFDPVGNGSLQCSLIVKTDAPNLTRVVIDIVGQSTSVTQHEDVFKPVINPKLDVLFVIDDSHSMLNEQALLSEELPQLALVAAELGTDYHLAVTTTDTLHQNGAFLGTPSYVTPEHDMAGFAESLQVGLDGSLHEKGLLAAHRALTGPHSDEQGTNAGFLRPDANLAIIFISDENDQSPDPIPIWAKRFASLKPTWTGKGVTLHAVVATREPCGETSSTGERYMSLAKAFSGTIADICEEGFSEGFALAGAKALAGNDRFYLSYPPVLASIQVKVNDSPCTDGWIWNNTVGAIVFTAESSCQPGPEDTVRISYSVGCPTP